MYCDALSLFHLTFVLSTFVFTQKFTLYLNMVLMIPVYTLEFCVVYAMRIPVVCNEQFISQFAPYFNFKYHMPVLEQLLYFSILACFYMSVSCFKLAFTHNQDKGMKSYFFKRCRDSTVYKFLFFFLKHIQTLVLICLFFNGAQNLNHFRNLGFMLFFVIYTASMELYRKTSKALVLFVAFFIVGEYFYSLEYHRFEIKGETKLTAMQKRFEWLSFWNVSNPPNWKQGSSIFFRHTPNIFDWAVLLLMNLLNLINYFFRDKKEVEEMQQICFDGIREKFTQTLYNAIRLKNFVQSYLIFVLLGVLLYFIGKAQVNLISWIFFVLNALMLSFIAKGDNKESTNMYTKRVATIIKYYSTFILVTDIVFVCLIGEEPQPNAHSYDQELLKACPLLYANLDLIGLRLYLDPARHPNPAEQRHMLKIKFFSYIAYLMVSLYLEATYAKKIAEQREEFEQCEEDYRVLFEWEENVKDEKTAGNIDQADGRTREGFGHRGDPDGRQAARGQRGSGGGSTAARAESDAPAGSE